MQRFGQIIGVKPEQIEAYELIHAAVWPEVLDTIQRCNMRNYTIFRHQHLLFAYFEYIGDDIEADMAIMAADPQTREWWTHTDPMQTPVAEAAEGEWWVAMKEVFHMD